MLFYTFNKKVLHQDTGSWLRWFIFRIWHKKIQLNAQNLLQARHIQDCLCSWCGHSLPNVNEAHTILWPVEQTMTYLRFEWANDINRLDNILLKINTKQRKYHFVNYKPTNSFSFQQIFICNQNRPNLLSPSEPPRILVCSLVCHPREHAVIGMAEASCTQPSNWQDWANQKIWNN